MSGFTHQTHTVIVKFRGNNRRYHYLTWRSDIKEGDTVVVKPQHAGFVCVEVVEVLYNTRTDMAFKYIVDKVDEDAYDRYMMQEAQEREIEARRQRRITELENRIEMRRHSIEAQLVQERMEQDPETRELMAELKRLKYPDNVA